MVYTGRKVCVKCVGKTTAVAPAVEGMHSAVFIKRPSSDSGYLRCVLLINSRQTRTPALED